jgi:ferrochelatase
VARYRSLGVEEHNPLNAITEETRAALERELGLPVFTGMKHWTPRIADAVDAALASGAEILVGLVLAPHYSRLSIAGYRTQVEDALEGRAVLRFVEDWHLHAPFIEWHASRLRGEEAHVVFTAHSLPARILADGDPYQQQLEETAGAIAQRARLREWSFSFQSESPTGEPWLGPDILDHLGALHARDVDDVLVCPIGFVSDHLEIRWDIDVEAQDRARELGIALRRIEMPNADAEFVRGLAELVTSALAASVV